MRIACPPTTHSCFYGIDTPKRQHLIASYMPLAEITAFVEADTLGYLDLKDLEGCMGDVDGQGFCYACFTGNYPVLPAGYGTGTAG